MVSSAAEEGLRLLRLTSFFSAGNEGASISGKISGSEVPGLLSGVIGRQA